MKNGDSVASAQYSDKCKIFIFPKDFLKASWVEKFEFSTLNKDLDLAFFLIYKKGDGSEAKIVPEPMVMEVGRAYKLINCEGKIKEKPINVEILKENKGSKVFKPNYPKSCKPELAPGHGMNSNQGHLAQYASNLSENINISSI